MGFGSNSLNRKIKSGFRSNSNRSGTTPAHDWMNYPDALSYAIERLRGVIIENRDALELMPQHDGEDTLFYVDPPYVHETRMTATEHGAHGYAHEMLDEDHVALASTLHGLSGKVILSGYHCGLYDEIYSDWTRVDHVALADGARPRIESLYLNAAAGVRVPQQRLIA
jgi:DNA adenine methylase